MTSIEKRLTDALAPIGWEIAVTVYKGTADRYLVIRHSDHPVDHGDDRPGALRVLVYVDIYCPLEEGEERDPATEDSPTPPSGDQTDSTVEAPEPSAWDETGTSSSAGGTSRWG